MKKLTTMCVLAGALMLTSCSMVEDEEIPAEELYTRSFIKAFGVIDPKQDWNMATQLTANVNISSLPSSTYRVRVYTANPINPDSRLMADYTLSKSSPSSFKFDALKGATEVFVTAEGSEGLAINGYYAVSNNTVSIGGETRAMTRADEETCNVKVEKTFTSTKTLTDKSTVTATFATLSNNGGMVVDTPWKMSDLLPIVGKNGKFHEGFGSDNSTNRERYKDVFEHDVVYLTNNEPIEVTFQYGGTAYYNKLAYYYWKKDGGDPTTAVRYILIDDARPNENVLSTNKEKLNNGMAWPQAIDYYEQYLETKSDNLAWANDNKDMYGTTYRLVFFDEKGNASYTFPEGYKVAFDLISNHSGSWPNEDDYLTYSNYSMREHNKAIEKYLDSQDYTKGGDVYAVTYKANGYTIMGFEDGVGNCDWDMNDIMFMVKGIDEEDDDIPVVIEDETKPQSWTIACEDLGSTDDYDFNDVVMNISYVSSNTDQKLTATPLAAGGVYKTEVYFGEKLLGEIHNLIDKKGERTTGSYPMLNTTSKGTAGDAIDLKEYLTDVQKTAVTNGTFSLSYDEAKQQNMAGFSIKVYKSESDNATVAETITAPTIGEVPQMFLVDGSWAWPTERTDIREAYKTENHAFKDWVKNTNDNDWWEYPSGSVVK